MSVRRIVTGQTPDGSAVVRDEQLPPITVGLMPGTEFYAVWGSDSLVSLPTDGQPPKTGGWFPTAGGFRFGVGVLPPESGVPSADFDQAGALAEINEKLPGMLDVFEPDNSGMHTTDSVDLVTVLSGEVCLGLDKEETVIRAGDTVVLNGSRHAWRNKSNQPCVLAVALIGASRSKES